MVEAAIRSEYLNLAKFNMVNEKCNRQQISEAILFHPDIKSWGGRI